MAVYILGKKDKAPDDAIVIDTTSHSKNWSQELSPFFLGPVEICVGLESKNVENAWQFSKVYKQHVDEKGNIKNKEYLDWAAKGWDDDWAHRYPMGRSAKPEFSVKLGAFGNCYLDGSNWHVEEYLPVKKFSYVEARKELYIPFYSKAVKESEAYAKLEDIFFNERKDIYLIDFDGYNHKALGMSYQDVIDNPDRKMGHAFVLGMLLEGFLHNQH